MWRGNGGTRYEIKWIQEVAEGHRGGSLDIETRWMQEVVEGHRGGTLDIETRLTQEVCGEARAGGKHRYSNHMCAKILNPNDDACKKLWRDEGEKPTYWNRMNAGNCWEAQVRDSLKYWSKMFARNCGEARGVPHMKPHECRKLLRGTRGEDERKKLQRG